MMGKGRIVHVLSVVCFMIASSAHFISAYPAGGPDDVTRMDGGFPDYSPSYVFVDDYLRHSDQHLSPSNSDLGNLIWGILYQPSQAPGYKRAGVEKRQQGWHVNYGKRQAGERPLVDVQRNQQPGDKGLVLFLDQHNRPYLGVPLAVVKGQTFRSRPQEQFGKYSGGIDVPVDIYGNRSPVAGQTQSHFGFGRDETRVGYMSKRQQGWHVPYGKRGVFGGVFEGQKRQQGWHANYGKRAVFGGVFEGQKRQQGWHANYGKR